MIFSGRKRILKGKAFLLIEERNPHFRPFERTGASVESKKAAFSLQKMKRIGMIRTGKTN